MENNTDTIKDLFSDQKKQVLISRNTSASERIKVLKILKMEILNKQREIERALREDFNKPEIETLMTEILPTITLINYTIKNLKKWMKPKKIKNSPLFFGTKNFISYESKGNVLIIAPWNYPFQLTFAPLITAISAGNVCMIKPSEFTPNINTVMEEILQKLFSQKEVSLIQGGVEQTQSLLSLPFDHIFFTGSTNVGKIIMNKASEHLASVTLELGGKSPAILAEDFHLDLFVEKIIWGKFINCGQTCVAPDYLMIPKHLEQEVISKLISEIEKRYGTDIKSNNDYSEIINDKNTKRIIHMIENAKALGAKIEYGGSEVGENKIAPTILTNLNERMDILNEEIFGPLFPIMTYENISEVTQYIEKDDHPLAIYLFTNSKQVIETIRSKTSSGGFSVNEVLLHVGNDKLAFGGVGKSGMGKYHGEEGFKELSNARGILIRNYPSFLNYFYPPYDSKKFDLLSFIVKRFNRFL